MSRFIITRNTIDGIRFRGKNINLLCLAYLLLWTLVPAFSVITNRGVFRILFAVILFCWILTAVQNLPQNVVIKSTILFGSFAIIAIVYWAVGYGDLGFYDLVNYLLLFGFSLNSMLYSKINSKRLDSMILKYSMVLLSLTVLTTTVALQTNSNAARLLTSSQTDEGATMLLRSQNVGAFDFIYGLVIVFPALIAMLKNGRKKLMKVYACILIMGVFTCVIKSNFTTALLLMFMGFLLPYIFNGSKNTGVKLCMFILIAAVAPLSLPYFLRFVYNRTTSILAKEKIKGLLLFMSGIGGAEDVSSRVTLFKMSLISFLKNPLLGVGGYYRTTTIANVGKHAQFIDDLARYGIIGGIPLLWFIYNSIKKSTAHDRIMSTAFFPSVVIFCVLGFMNPIYNYGVLACFFIIASTLARYVDRGIE